MSLIGDERTHLTVVRNGRNGAQSGPSCRLPEPAIFDPKRLFEGRLLGKIVSLSYAGARDAGILGQKLQSRRYFSHLGISVEFGGPGRKQLARGGSRFFGHMGSFYMA